VSTIPRELPPDVVQILARPVSDIIRLSALLSLCRRHGLTYVESWELRLRRRRCGKGFSYLGNTSGRTPKNSDCCRRDGNCQLAHAKLLFLGLSNSLHVDGTGVGSPPQNHNHVAVVPSFAAAWLAPGPPELLLALRLFGRWVRASTEFPMRL
jgi:hypothetical protein